MEYHEHILFSAVQRINPVSNQYQTTYPHLRGYYWLHDFHLRKCNTLSEILRMSEMTNVYNPEVVLQSDVGVYS